MQGMDALGEAVTGGMAARAVEPHAGEAAHGHGQSCLNCGTGLIGDYCHRCGQQGHVHRTLGAFWHDLLHGVLHFDGKIWRTLPMLAFRPGELTRRYVAGERARFVSPIALFLFSVFLMFAAFSLSGNSVIGAPGGSNAEEQAELREAEQRIRELEARRAQLIESRQSTAATDVELREARIAHGALSLVNGGARESIELNSGWRRLDEGLKKASGNPALLFYKLQTNAYKFSWALIPISVPFVWLMFLHRRRYRAYGAYAHVVFVTYSIAFMSLGLIALLIGTMVGLGGGWLVAAATIVPPLHMYKQLKGAYSLSRGKALWRTFVLLVFVSLTLTLFSTLLLTLGVLG